MIDTARRSARAAAYGELVAGLLDVRDDTATQRFDAALESAVAVGQVDPEVARRLRWLQRESVRGVVDHARTAVPAALLGLDEAREDATSDAPLPDPAIVVESASDEAAPEPTSDDVGASVESFVAPLPRRLLVAGLTVLPSNP